MLSLKRQFGFTLMEMMVTLGILSIMAAVAVPNYLSYLPKSRLNGAARVLMGDLMDARMKAVKENNEYKFFFINDHEYKILDDNDNDGNETNPGEVAVIKNIQNEYQDVTLSWTSNYVTFYPRGTAHGSTITLDNEGSGCKKVKINGFTGRVKIEDSDDCS